MEASVSKFTKLLPLFIRKDSSVGNGVGLSSSLSGSNPVTAADRGFFQQGAPASSTDPFRDPFEAPSMSMNACPSVNSYSEQKEFVRVTVTYPSPAVGAMNTHKEISLRLTNDENPMFFYHLKISDVDYPLIKSQQGLLVDFFGFPNQLVTLLEKCDPAASSSDDDGKSILGVCPKFILVMKIGIHSVLDIVESNPFKYLCHLSLPINPGSDGEVKKYLADVTTGMKKECGLWQEKYSHLAAATEGELARIKGLLNQKNEELIQLRDEIHTQANSLSNKHFQDMSFEKEKLMKMQSELASKYENDRHDLERRHSQTIAALESRISSLEAENRDLIKTKFKNDNSLKDTNTKIKNLEDDLKLLQQEITLARKQNEKLDHDYHDKQRMSNSLQNRLTVVESDLKEKQSAFERQQEYNAQLLEQKRFLEDHATNMVKEVEKLKIVNKNVSTELIKANEIIKKLQDDIRSLHTKNKLQMQITLEQERLLTDREKQIKHLEDTVSTMKLALSTLEDSESQTKKELEESKGKIEALENTIKSNENMISWLNKQLNDFQGLGNLTRFRQNLASTGTGGPTGSLQGRLNFPESLGTMNASANATNGSLRNGGLFSSNAHNTLPNGTPSWMHIYQSTSTPLENDLTSRFERINVRPNNESSLTKSRLDTISEKTGEATSAKSNEENQEPNSSAIHRRALSEKTTSTNVRAKPPTWAKPRTGKVTLEVVAPIKSNPTWRNN